MIYAHGLQAFVLRRMQWSKHFCRLHLAGRRSPNCNIVIMSLVGRSLSWLRRQNPGQRFTLSTAIRVGLQCLQVCTGIILNKQYNKISKEDKNVMS